MTRKTWAVTGAGSLAAVIVVAFVLALSRPDHQPRTSQAVVPTAKVEKGELAAVVSLNGTLTHRGQADGSPYSVINRARGIYTKLPGNKVGCGDVLYEVDDHPVLMLCGSVPAYRDQHLGEGGTDVRQLNRNLHDLGYDSGARVGPEGKLFTWQTQRALEKLQRDRGGDVTGTLDLDDAVFLPESMLISKVTAQLGGSAQPGAQVAQATSDTLEVQLTLDASQQGQVRKGDTAQIILPSNQSVTGKVDRLGRVALASAGKDADPASATIPIYVSLDDPDKARGLDEAPVRVEISTQGVKDALNVPVTAIVGKSGGGFAVEVVRVGGRRELIAVKLGLFDATAGRVQIEGDVHVGDRVVVPRS